MLQAYSTDVTVTALAPVPFNSLAVSKGCSETLETPTTVALKRCGVYEVSVNASAAASQTVQLYRDGVALPQAVSTGTAMGFTCLVQVNENSCKCNPCTAPVRLQVVATGAGTLTDASITVTKIA